MQRINGTVRHYDWGDTEFLPRLLGAEPDGRPWAELWLGTHPASPSSLDDGTPLAEVTGRLPYLLKVLAVARPLSLQTHPDANQARAGFARGVFADPSAKPELLCALTPFEAFCGIRPPERTIGLLRELGIDELARPLTDSGPRAALESLYRGAVDVASIVERCTHSDRPEAAWVRRLDEIYPAEPSVAATLLLNLVVIEPGEAIRLDAGNLHAYLHGTGIELMGPSDNVVRAGLTHKPVDVELLLDIVDTRPLVEPVLDAGDGYRLPAAGVELRRIDTGGHHTATGHELTIDMFGASWHLAPGDTIVADEVTFVARPTE